MSDTTCKVEEVQLVSELEQRSAYATVTIGAVKISGLTVWRSRNGHLRVFWPSYKPHTGGYGWLPVIELDPELTAAIEAQVIAAYKDVKAKTKAA